jgi:hypothetical protein
MSQDVRVRDDLVFFIRPMTLNCQSGYQQKCQKYFFLSMCDVKVFLTFGADLTTVLPVLFKYCITKLPNSEQSNEGKVKTHKYINRQNQSTTGKL